MAHGAVSPSCSLSNACLVLNLYHEYKCHPVMIFGSKNTCFLIGVLERVALFGTFIYPSCCASISCFLVVISHKSAIFRNYPPFFGE